MNLALAETPVNDGQESFRHVPFAPAALGEDISTIESVIDDASIDHTHHAI